jgi:hypothetical protein
MNVYVQAVFVERFMDLSFRVARVQVMFGACAPFRYIYHYRILVFLNSIKIPFY